MVRILILYACVSCSPPLQPRTTRHVPMQKLLSNSCLCEMKFFLFCLSVPHNLCVRPSVAHVVACCEPDTNAFCRVACQDRRKPRTTPTQVCTSNDLSVHKLISPSQLRTNESTSLNEEFVTGIHELGSGEAPSKHRNLHIRLGNNVTEYPTSFGRPFSQWLL